MALLNASRCPFRTRWVGIDPTGGGGVKDTVQDPLPGTLHDPLHTLSMTGC